MVSDKPLDLIGRHVFFSYTKSGVFLAYFHSLLHRSNDDLHLIMLDILIKTPSRNPFLEL